MKKLIFCLALTLPVLFSCQEKQPAQKPAATEKQPVMDLPDTIKIDTDTAIFTTKAEPKAEKPVFDPFAGRNKWVLIQLKGKRVAIDRSQQQAFLIFDREALKVKGNASCNSISGNFALSGNDGISFSEMAATRMACPDMTTENSFLEALSKAQYYKVNESEMMLFKDQGTPLAVLVLVQGN